MKTIMRNAGTNSISSPIPAIIKNFLDRILLPPVTCLRLFQHCLEALSTLPFFRASILPCNWWCYTITFAFLGLYKRLNRIAKYKLELKKEKDWKGFISDGFGKRYLLFCFYFVLGDFDNTDEYFEWYKKEFPDDIGDPIQQLCWALSLHRMEKDKEARYRLAELMLSNLYIILLSLLV